MAAGLTLLALSWSAAACDSESAEREYSLPGSLCGASVPEDLYAPLFPPGAALDTEQSFDDVTEFSGSRYCVLSVDGEEILRADATGQDDYSGAIVRHDLDVEEQDGEAVPGDFEAVVWPGVAMAKAPCTLPGIGGSNTIETLMVVLQAEHPGGDDESKQVLSELIQPFMAGTLDMVACQEHEAEGTE
ncbi:hypothetical protein [Streptomyces sp. NBC_01803]|uniref:hypothetical protein n=1 Tax=Streptomyces sp. NBC_01803 TaxID=2975946 RepID=UPI002DD7FACB|nr:hypothetical protein [Streptomyces sp. NBC_01803]WSA46790.1 hypothetical protein OIE51_22960 [Streptomyces sp. NBC_01803]